jgi:hypothetical protein
MLLRLLLVGAVAGLGFDLPARREVERWVCSARAWWDARSAATADLLPNADEASSIAELNDAPDGTSLSSALTSEPKTVLEENCQDRDFVAVVASVVAGFMSDTGNHPTELAEPDNDLYPGIAHALNRESEGLAPINASAQAAGADLASAVLDEDLYPGLAYALNRDSEGLTPIVAPAEEPRASLASIEPEPTPVGEDLYPGLAFELNRAAEGISPPIPTPATPSEVAATIPDRPAQASVEQERLANAVRLTEEAFRAWVAVLQTPAVLSAEHAVDVSTR